MSTPFTGFFPQPSFSFPTNNALNAVNVADLNQDGKVGFIELQQAIALERQKRFFAPSDTLDIMLLMNRNFSRLANAAGATPLRPLLPESANWRQAGFPSQAEYNNYLHWVQENDLNRYGDPKDTAYLGGTPLFNEATGQSTPLFQYAAGRHPNRPWNAPLLSNTIEAADITAAAGRDGNAGDLSSRDIRLLNGGFPFPFPQPPFPGPFPGPFPQPQPLPNPFFGFFQQMLQLMQQLLGFLFQR